MLGMGPILWRQVFLRLHNHDAPAEPIPRRLVRGHPAALLYYKALDRINAGIKSC